MLPARADQRKQTAMMARIFFNKQSLVLLAALALPFAGGACFALSVHAGTSTRLQDIADDAALAGVNSLAANIDQPADVNSAEAIAAARAVIASQPRVIQRLHPSVDALTMSVVCGRCRQRNAGLRNRTICSCKRRPIGPADRPHARIHRRRSLMRTDQRTGWFKIARSVRSRLKDCRSCSSAATSRS